MNQTNPAPGRQIWRWLPGVLLSAIAIFVLATLADPATLLTSLQQMMSWQLVLAVVIFLVSMGLRALAWQYLLRKQASFPQSFWVMNQGYLINNLLPLRLGEIGRALLMGDKARLSPLHILSTIVIERFFDLGNAGLLLVMTLPLALGMEWAWPLAVTTLGIVLAGMIVLWLLARQRQRWLPWLAARLQRWPRLAGMVMPRMEPLLDGLGALTEPRWFASGWLWLALSWGLAVVEYWLLLTVIAPQAPLWWGAFALGVVAAGVALPSAPSSVGVFEAAIVGALALLGIEPGPALAYALTLHIMHFAFSSGLGLIALFRDGESLPGLIQRLFNRAGLRSPAAS